MRIMGIDYGDSRIGVAMSDPMGWTAQGLETINEKNMDRAVTRIKELADAYNVDKIVVGLPKNMNGTIGERGEITLQFIDKMQQVLNKEVIMWDERLTTVAAHKMLNETNVRGKKRKQVVDTVAASYILQGYLDSIIK
ncbi:Holliday junction resolvase RuvX [Petroclostridium sp. X23]|uniref:Holliday junction resolvase RuvX n=1 Tax=Petroclostridium sp. X23 TaxID=3045146 RepID=UPI0024AD5533|nr:Holliday junction resolvase RuvX [Petroclostridium sp. X23]WHH60184.1 Holliday junction resolvase RuvX [Petroclostridium sp. X23]